MHPFPSSDTVPRSLGRWRRFCPLALAAFLSPLGINSAAGAAAPQEVFDEYAVKAHMIRNFIQFIGWPTQAFQSTNSPLVIGVMGSSAIGVPLRSAIQDIKYKGRKIEVRSEVTSAEAKACHLLFVSKSEKGKVAQVLDSLRGISVITTGEMPDFAKQGGVFNVIIEGGKPCFEVNPEVAQRQGVIIDSRLLMQGKCVKGDSRKEIK